MVSQTLALMTKSIRASRVKAVIIQTNCLPLRQPQSKIDDGSIDWTEA